MMILTTGLDEKNTRVCRCRAGGKLQASCFSIKRQIFFPVTVLIAAIVLSLSVVAADYYNDDFDVLAADRSTALYQAVLKVTEKSFAHLLGKEHWNKALDACLAMWIQPQKTANDYKPLLEDYYFRVDEVIANQYALQGTLVVNMDYITFLWNRHQQRPQCELKLPATQSAYLEPVVNTHTAQAQLLNRVRESLKRQLIDEHFLLVDHQHGATASIRIQLNSAWVDSHNNIKSLSVRADYSDNRVDGRIELALNADVVSNLVTTEGALDADLYHRAAQLMLRQIREHSILANSQRTQIYYTLQSPVSLNQQDQLLNRVAEAFALPQDFTETLNLLQLTERDDGAYTLGLMIPARYGFSLKRSHLSVLRSLGEAVFQEKIITQKVTIDNDSVVFSSVPDAKPWKAAFDRLMARNHLLLPEGRNALSTVQQRLRTAPDDQQALAALDQLTQALVNRAVYKISQQNVQNAYGDLIAAQQAGERRPQKPWLKPLQALKQQLKLIDTQPVSALVEDQLSSSTVMQTELLFPRVESYRGFSVQASAPLLGLVASTQGIYTIKVNGRLIASQPATAEQARLLRVRGASTHAFEISDADIAGREKVTVTITDTAGKVVQKQLRRQGSGFRVVDTAANTKAQQKLLAQGALALKARLHILLIANQAYEQWGRLQTPYRDVEQLRQLLIDNYRVQAENITLLKDATKHQMEIALDRLHDTVGINDSLLVYYAGHGHLDQRSGRDGYWIPVDGKAYDAVDRRTSWLSNAAVADTIEQLKARHVLLISDSCYAGTFATRGRQGGDFIASVNHIKGLAAKRSRLAITSGNVEPVNDLGPSGHSIFAYHLLQTLRNNKAPFLTAGELFQSLSPPVRRVAKQAPQHFPFTAADEGGELVFVAKEVVL